MGSPWFSHVRQTEKHIFSSSGSAVPGLFFLEASNPGGSLAWRHSVLPPPLCRLMCCTHALISSGAHERQSQLWSLWLLTSEHLIKTDCLIWPAEGVKRWRKEVLSENVGWCGYEAASPAPSPSLIRSSPPSSFSESYSAAWASCDQEVWLPSISPPDRKEIL